MTRHFLTLTDLTPDELGYLIQQIGRASCRERV